MSSPYTCVCHNLIRSPVLECSKATFTAVKVKTSTDGVYLMSDAPPC